LAASGRNIIGETLRVLTADLESRVAPHLQDADAILAAKMIADLLGYLAIWHLEPLDRDDPSDATFVHGPAQSGIGAPPWPSDVPAAGLERGLRAAALQQAIEEAASPDMKLLTAAVAGDSALYQAEAIAAPRIGASAAERLAQVEITLDAERAGKLVRRCLGEGYEVESVVRVPGGFSKDSFFLDLRARTGESERVVVRRDLPFGPGETRVVAEYALLRSLAGRDLLIAEPLGCDPTGIVGQPAMISRRVSGNSGTAPWDADPVLRRDICLTLAGVLARLHAIVPADVGLAPVSCDPREQLRAQVLEWRDRWRRNRVHASPTLAAAFFWLLDNIPAEIDRVSIIHGDVGFHNMIVDDGRLAALLDWEFAHLGDPTEDLGYCRQFVEPLMPWEDFLQGYRAAGGGDYRDENARFFELWRAVRNAVCCSVSWRGFLSGAYPALKMAYQGIPLYRVFVHHTAEALKEKFQCETPAATP